jgi:hypothetical protein
MPNLDDLNDNILVQAVLEDVPKTNMDDGAVVDEHEFYVQKVGFYLVHTLTWCKQLHSASELLTNFDYSKRIGASRADHLIYGIENYLIRLNSVYDRVLQLVNTVFHLCINEEHVSHSIIISNYKVQHRPEIVRRIKAIKKYLDRYSQERHTLVHRHSLLDEKLRRIELFYMHDYTNIGWTEDRVRDFKLFRANYLREYVIQKKEEFATTNAALADLICDLFSALHQEYTLQREAFRLCGL